MKFNIGLFSFNEKYISEITEIEVEAESFEEASKIASLEASKRRALAIVSEVETE